VRLVGDVSPLAGRHAHEVHARHERRHDEEEKGRDEARLEERAVHGERRGGDGGGGARECVIGRGEESFAYESGLVRAGVA
jgi:hypothetical protein